MTQKIMKLSAQTIVTIFHLTIHNYPQEYQTNMQAQKHIAMWASLV
jgi:hypothetical protein